PSPRRRELPGDPRYQRLRALQEPGGPGPGAAARHSGEGATDHRRAHRRGRQRLRPHGRDDRRCLRDGDRPRGGFHAPQGERTQDGVPVPRAEARRPESVSDGVLGLPPNTFRDRSPMPSRMSAGDEIAVVEGYRTILRDCLASMDPAAVLRLRGELQVLSRWLAVQKKSALQRTADEALYAVSRFYRYGQEIDGLRASNRSAETASYYDLASVGVLAVENVLTAGHPSLMRFLMSGLSEGLMFLGSRQYVSGSDAVLIASWR